MILLDTDLRSRPPKPCARANTPARRCLPSLLQGVSTRHYREVVPRVAATVGVSKSTATREAVETSAQQLEELLERRWDQVESLAISIDGAQFGDHQVLSAVSARVAGLRSPAENRGGMTPLGETRNGAWTSSRKLLAQSSGHRGRTVVEPTVQRSVPTTWCSEDGARGLLTFSGSNRKRPPALSLFLCGLVRTRFWPR